MQTTLSRMRMWRTTGRLAAMLLAAISVAAMLWAAPAGGQVRPVQGGNALDANPMAGSGGYNVARPVTSGINGNLIVTGNVTGGRAFRGYSPIQDPNTLQTGIPSAAIGDFIKDSVGLPSVTSGLSNYSPRPYYNPSSTAVTSGTVQNQALLPRQVTGTYSTGQFQSQMPVTPLTGSRAIGQIAPELPNAAPTWQPTGTGMFRPDIVLGQVDRPERNPLSPYPLTAPTEVSEVRPATLSPGERRTQADRATLPPESPLTQLLKPQISQDAGAGPLEVQPTPGTVGGAPLAADRTGRPTRDPAEARIASLAGTTTPGTADEQAGSSLLTAMQRYTQAVREAITPAEPQLSADLSAAARRPGDELLLASPNLTENQRQRLRADISRAQAARVLDERLRAPIRTLAGARRTQVDRMLARAEDLMEQGQYYQAAQVYDGVIATNPDNTLAWLGRSNALLAAGDYVSAYLSLEQGIQRFPEMLRFDFDLPDLVGNREVLDVRRAEIERTLALTPSYQLRFLLGYLEYFSGLRDIGLGTLQQAAEAAPAGSIVPQAYQILASEARPGPATQPAG